MARAEEKAKAQAEARLRAEEGYKVQTEQAEEYYAGEIAKVRKTIEQAKVELEEKDRIRGELLNETFNIQEEERKRIARELHDETAQVIASLAAQVDSVINSLLENVSQIIPKLKRIRSLHTDLLSDFRRVLRNC